MNLPHHPPSLLRCGLQLAICAVVVLVSAAGAAENWPGWRGPGGNAISSEKSLPVRWSTTKNVLWKVPVEGEGGSSPIVWQQHVFVTSALDEGTRRLLHCLDARSGKTLWRHEIKHPRPEDTSALAGHAAATPVTDGKHVVAMFGNAGAVCYDFSGKRLWQRGFGDFDSELGLASSPILHDGHVILLCDHDGDRFGTFDSFLVALDVKTGKQVWKTVRRGLFRSWSTPLLVPAPGGKRELVINAQDALRAYDPTTGKQLWQVDGMTGWVTPSPVFGKGLVFATSGKDGPTIAVRLGGRGNVTKTHVVWQMRRGAPYVCSPLLYGDYLYVHDEQGVLTCRKAASGEVVYRQRLGGKFVASAVAGDGKIYLSNEAGQTLVIRAGPKYELLAKNPLKEECLASPAISGGRLFLRTERHLYCIKGL